MKLIILGPPGSGKGTLAKVIIEKQHLTHISTGDLFRQKITEENELAHEIKNLLNAGELVPDTITNKITKHAILEANQKNANGFILDGYPRTIAQADFLKGVIDIDYVVYLDVEKSVLLKRIIGRRICSNCGAIYNIETAPKPLFEKECDKCKGLLFQRKDDNLETANHRIDVYFEKTQPLINYYKKEGILKTLNGTLSVEELYENVLKLFKQK